MPRNISFETSLASPNQASTIFGPDGAHPIRQKGLFVVRFIRQASSGSDWRDDLSFVVKTMDRPSVEAVTETVNQYNKKKIIHTGVKYNPVNVTFHDTADGAAMNLWQEYASYYFADYMQPPASFNDDLLNTQLNDPSGKKLGWGFRVRETNSIDKEGIGSQYFFSAIEIMQLWGNEYTSYQLVNPRITSFTPDDLDYSSSESCTIAMNISFEAISHQNSGRSMDIFTQESLTNLFENGPFSGQVLEVSGYRKSNDFVTNVQEQVSGTDYTQSEEVSTQTQTFRETNTSGGGVLSRFGTYDFGEASQNDFTTSPDYLTPAIGGSLAAGYGQVNDATAGAGEAALNLPNMASSINMAAINQGNSAVDNINRDDGLRLSDQVIDQFNKLNDGTFLMGYRRTA